MKWYKLLAPIKQNSPHMSPIYSIWKIYKIYIYAKIFWRYIRAIMLRYRWCLCSVSLERSLFYIRIISAPYVRFCMVFLRRSEMSYYTSLLLYLTCISKVFLCDGNWFHFVLMSKTSLYAKGNSLHRKHSKGIPN